jgi:hypothetical protein
VRHAGFVHVLSLSKEITFLGWLCSLFNFLSKWLIYMKLCISSMPLKVIPVPQIYAASYLTTGVCCGLMILTLGLHVTVFYVWLHLKASFLNFCNQNQSLNYP